MRTGRQRPTKRKENESETKNKTSLMSWNKKNLYFCIKIERGCDKTP
jgi:hypothetical protein